MCHRNVLKCGYFVTVDMALGATLSLGTVVASLTLRGG
jgi:hypothetical protein